MRRAWLKLLTGALAVAAVGLQLWPAPLRDYPPVESEPAFPPLVAGSVCRACYDCHSHQTRWPWYSQVAPISWWIGREVGDGRERLNFSRWESYSPRRQQRLLESAVEMSRQGHMPPALYPHARLSGEEQAALRRWVANYEAGAFGPVLASSGTIHGAEGSILRLPRLAWPTFEFLARAWKGERELTGSWSASELAGSLRLRQGLIFVTGDAELTRLEGTGALIALGRVRVGQVRGDHLAILGRRGVEILGGELEGLVYAEHDVRLRDLRLHGRAVANGAQSQLILERVDLHPGTELVAFPVPGLTARSFRYCRDDGEIGEPERDLKIVRGHGQYMLMDSEFETSRRARSLQEALQRAEELLRQDLATSLRMWHQRFREEWVTELKSEGSPAVFEYHLGEAVPR